MNSSTGISHCRFQLTTSRGSSNDFSDTRKHPKARNPDSHAALLFGKGIPIGLTSRFAATSSSIATAFWIGLGGLFLMGGNLIYAHLLSKADFGRLNLLLANYFLLSGLIPLGFDKLVARGQLFPSGAFLTRFCPLALLVIIGFLIGVGRLFDLLFSECVVIGVTAFFAGLVYFHAALYQRKLKLNTAQALIQLPFCVYLLGSIVSMAMGIDSAAEAFIFFTIGYAINLVFIAVVRATRQEFYSRWEAEISNPSFLRHAKQAFSFLGIAGSFIVLNQIERLSAGRFLTWEDLATLGLVITLVGSPFRLMGAGSAFSLMPRMLNEKNPAIRKSLFFQEIIFLLGVGVLITLFALLAVPWLVHIFYGQKYALSYSLIVLMIANGSIKMLYGCVSALVNATASSRTLFWFNLVGWINMALTVVLIYLLRGYGISGIVIGSTLGWLLRTASGYTISSPALKQL